MDFALIETFGWWPEGGFRRLDRHLARLKRSAEHFGWRCDVSGLKSELTDMVAGDSPLRVRLQYAGSGIEELSLVPFEPMAEDTIWRIGVARQAIDPGEELLRHKTTGRALYDTARNEFARGEVDEVILLNNRGDVCEGTITSIFIRREPDGLLLTPALECGLLPGVLREEAIAMGEAAEAVLRLDDLRYACEMFVGNSLRGLIRAQLMETIRT